MAQRDSDAQRQRRVQELKREAQVTREFLASRAKRMSRFTLRGVTKVRTQWNLYCLMHNIEKLGHLSYAH